MTDCVRAYHFLPAAHALDDLARRRLKISRLDDLNDPFELLALDLPDPKHRKVLRGFISDMSRRYGVICFSRSWHNPLLWSHYADKHRGICLGFDIPRDCAEPISYSVSRLPIQIRVELEHGGLDKSDMKQLLFTKFREWRYEDEVRTMVHLSDIDAATGYYFSDFSAHLVLREVILGARCTARIQEISKLCAAESPRVDIIPGRLAFRSFRVVRNRAVHQ